MNPSCSNSPSKGCKIKKIGIPHVPSSFSGASRPSSLHSIRRHHITARFYAKHFHFVYRNLANNVWCNVFNLKFLSQIFEFQSLKSLSPFRCLQGKMTGARAETKQRILNSGAHCIVEFSQAPTQTPGNHHLIMKNAPHTTTKAPHIMMTNKAPHIM